ncbi:MAG: hypothetical protein AAGH74_01335 [Pseudomonadota bacterium]
MAEIEGATQTDRGWIGQIAGGISARPLLVRWILAGPMTLIASFLIMAGMVFWIPEGEARIDNIAVPVILFPLIWSAVFFYVSIEQNLPRGVIIMTLLCVSQLGILISGF